MILQPKSPQPATLQHISSSNNLPSYLQTSTCSSYGVAIIPIISTLPFQHNLQHSISNQLSLITQRACPLILGHQSMESPLYIHIPSTTLHARPPRHLHHLPPIILISIPSKSLFPSFLRLSACCSSGVAMLISPPTNCPPARAAHGPRDHHLVKIELKIWLLDDVTIYH